jgi:hypothetical protein
MEGDMNGEDIALVIAFIAIVSAIVSIVSLVQGWG